MKYKVTYMPQAQKQLKKMDRNQARIIVAWIRKIWKELMIRASMEKDCQEIEVMNDVIELETIVY